MQVLVTGLFEPGALAAIRRLARLGAEITAADCHRMAYGMYSKHVARRVALPPLREQPAEYAQALLRELEAGAYDYYFPGYEEIILLSHFRERLFRNTRSVIPCHDKLVRLHDKSKLADLAAQAGVPSPEVWRPGSVAEAAELAKRTDGPLAIKLRQGAGAGGMRVVRGRGQLGELYRQVIEARGLSEPDFPLVQRWVNGPTVCSLELHCEGEPVGQVFFRGLRTVPRTAGTTVMRETVPGGPCAEASRALVSELGYTGFVGFDYVVSDGVPYVVDANPRLTPALNLAERAGCDMVPAWLEIADGRRPKALDEPAQGVRTRNQFGDVTWLLGSWLHSWTDWRTERELRRGWWKDRRCPDDVADLSDPLPNLVLWGYVLANLPKLLTSKLDSADLFMFHNRYMEKASFGSIPED